MCWSSLSMLSVALSAAPVDAQEQTQAPPPAQKQQAYPELPEGAGKDALIRVCSKCHSPSKVVAYGQDRAGWENTLTKMAGFGAQASDDDFTAIRDYLVKNFPPAPDTINVNQATAAQLQSGLGLSSMEADTVVQYRKEN